MSTDTIRPDDETVRGWLENATHEEVEREVLRSRQRESDLERELAQAREALRRIAAGDFTGTHEDFAEAALTPTAREAAAATKPTDGGETP